MEDFEHWLNSSKTQLEDCVYGLFSDSLKCYKNDIDRPAYLLAYQGMMMHLKYVIKHGKCPSDFEENEWRDILNKISKDSGWDDEVFTKVRQESTGRSKQVFCISNEIRRKFDYWRDIRNICAHYKEYKFIKAHTLTLYSFISQYLLAMTIEGGKESLLKEFEEYFDPISTSPREPIKPYIDKIIKVVPEAELVQFFKELLNQTTEGRKDKLIEELYSNTIIKSKFIDFLRIEENSYYQRRLIYENPKRVLDIIKNNDKSIRQFWKSELKLYPNKLSILCQIIESGIIRSEDIPEVIDDYICKLYEENSSEILNLSEGEISILKNHGFFESFFSRYFNKEYMGEKYIDINNKRCNFYISFLKVLGMTENVVKGLVDIFNDGFYPYTLRNFIKNEILDGGEKLRFELEKKCSNLGLAFPVNLKNNAN